MKIGLKKRKVSPKICQKSVFGLKRYFTYGNFFLLICGRNFFFWENFPFLWGNFLLKFFNNFGKIFLFFGNAFLIIYLIPQNNAELLIYEQHLIFNEIDNFYQKPRNLNLNVVRWSPEIRLSTNWMVENINLLAISLSRMT